MLPTATDPKAIDGGETEMAAVGAGVLEFWLGDFVVPAIPIHPEIESTPKSITGRASGRIHSAHVFIDAND